MDKIDMRDELHELFRELAARGEGEDASLIRWSLDEIERLRQHIRRQAEDIITLGQMVGRNCPICQKSE